MEVLSWILFGFVVGLVARALMPGPDSMGFVGTTVLGIFGALLGGAFTRLMGWSSPGGSGTLLSATLGAIAVLSASQFLMRGRRARKTGMPVSSVESKGEKEKGGRAA